MGYGKNDKMQNIKCNPSTKHLYLIPEIHSNAPVMSGEYNDSTLLALKRDGIGLEAQP